METIKQIVEILAILSAPIIAVWLGQHLHNKEIQRKDKLEIFKILMATRKGWTIESVKALNIIEIVFSSDEQVLECWRDYYDKIWIQNPSNSDYQKIEIAKGKMLEAMANSLGYKNSVTWETIQNPYVPQGIQQDAEIERQLKQAQLAWGELIKQALENNTKREASQVPQQEENTITDN